MIPECYVEQNLSYSLSGHPTLNVLLKYKNQQSINTIKFFSTIVKFFLQVDKNTVLEEIRKLNLSKVLQDTDIPVRILKEESYICKNLTYMPSN